MPASYSPTRKQGEVPGGVLAVLAEPVALGVLLLLVGTWSAAAGRTRAQTLTTSQEPDPPAEDSGWTARSAVLGAVEGRWEPRSIETAVAHLEEVGLLQSRRVVTSSDAQRPPVAIAEYRPTVLAIQLLRDAVALSAETLRPSGPYAIESRTFGVLASRDRVRMLIDLLASGPRTRQQLALAVQPDLDLSGDDPAAVISGAVGADLAALIGLGLVVVRRNPSVPGNLYAVPRNLEPELRRGLLHGTGLEWPAVVAALSGLQQSSPGTEPVSERRLIDQLVTQVAEIYEVLASATRLRLIDVMLAIGRPATINEINKQMQRTVAADLELFRERGLVHHAPPDSQGAKAPHRHWLWPTDSLVTTRAAFRLVVAWCTEWAQVRTLNPDAMLRVFDGLAAPSRRQLVFAAIRLRHAGMSATTPVLAQLLNMHPGSVAHAVRTLCDAAVMRVEGWREERQVVLPVSLPRLLLRAVSVGLRDSDAPETGDVIPRLLDAEARAWGLQRVDDPPQMHQRMATGPDRPAPAHRDTGRGGTHSM